MASNFQDDERENAMIRLFNLHKDVEESRSGVDAYLALDGKEIPFELKTTSKGSVTTVRDFGLSHIQKWKDKHWLIRFFVKGREYYKYGSPSMMAPWIEEKKRYIEPDIKLASLLPVKLTLDDLFSILGEKPFYTLDDAKYIQKKQYKQAQYLELQDLDNGYSSEKMLQILRERAEYVMRRGSTLNNPHIPFGYFKGWKEITENHAEELRILVRGYFRQL